MPNGPKWANMPTQPLLGFGRDHQASDYEGSCMRATTMTHLDHDAGGYASKWGILSGSRSKGVPQETSGLEGTLSFAEACQSEGVSEHLGAVERLTHHEYSWCFL